MRNEWTITVSPNPGHGPGAAAIGRVSRARFLPRARLRRYSLASCARATERTGTRIARSRTCVQSDTLQPRDGDPAPQSCRPASYPQAATTPVASREPHSRHRCPGSTAAFGDWLRPFETLWLGPHPSTCTDRAIAQPTLRSLGVGAKDAHIRVATLAAHQNGACTDEGSGHRRARLVASAPHYMSRRHTRSVQQHACTHFRVAPHLHVEGAIQVRSRNDSSPGVITW